MSTIRTDQSSNRLSAVVYALGGAIFLLGTSEFMIAGLLPTMADSLSVSLTQVGLLISAFALGMAIGAPVMAVLTLRLPRRTTLGTALVIFAAAHLLAGTSSSYPVVLIARVVTAVATGTFWAVAAVVVAGAVASVARARALSVLIGGLTVANVAGVPIGTWLGESFGWRTPFLVLSVAAVIAVAVLLPIVPRALSASASASSSASSASASASASSDVRSELQAFRNGRLWLSLATIAALQAGVFGAFSYVTPLLTDVAGVPSGAVPLALALFGVGALTGSQIGGRLGDAHPWPVLLGALGATVVVFVLLTLFAGSTVAAVALVGLYGLTGFTTAAPLTSRVIGLAGPAPTLASATTTSAFNVGNTIGPWLAGITLGVSGLRAPLVLAAGSVAVALGLAVWSRHLDRLTGPTPTDPAAARSRECAAAEA